MLSSLTPLHLITTKGVAFAYKNGMYKFVILSAVIELYCFSYIANSD